MQAVFNPSIYDTSESIIDIVIQQYEGYKRVLLLYRIGFTEFSIFNEEEEYFKVAITVNDTFLRERILEKLKMHWWEERYIFIVCAAVILLLLLLVIFL